MTTVNYGWTLPTVGASVNAWGTLVNTILTDIDAKMFARTGGAISGNVSVNASGMTTAMQVGQYAGSTTYGTVNFNGGTTFANTSGIIGGGAVGNMYAMVPSGASHQALVNGATITTVSSTGLAVSGVVISGDGTGIGGVSLRSAAGSSNELTWYKGVSARYAMGRNTGSGGADDLAIYDYGLGATIANFSGGNFLPGSNGGSKIGSTSLRWGELWVTTGAFNTSNAFLKTPIRAMQDKELAAGFQMSQELGTFQWLESVKEKGNKARRHVGLTVQRAAEIMEFHGLDPWSYGFMGYDKWEAVTEIVDATEADEGACQEQVTRQKTEKQTSRQQTVEIVNGQPVLKVEPVESDVPVTEQIQVVDADGKPVFIDVPEVPAVLDEEGNEATPAIPAHQVPMMHAVPVMETVQVWKRVKEVRPAGESYAFRSDQLAFFIAAGVAAKVGA